MFAVLSSLMGEMALEVVIGEEVIVRLAQFWNGGRLGIRPIREAAFDVKVRLNVRLPGLATLNLQLDDTQGVVDALSLFRLEDCATIADERLRRTVLRNGRT